jgi:antitoxin component of MazEF toxin-antitoxin module
MKKKVDKKNIRKLTKTGGHSIGVTIPIEVVRELGWRERQKVVIEKRGKELIIKDWKK